MKNKFKTGDYTYHRRKDTYWIVLSMPGRYAVVEKRFDRGLKQAHKKIVKIYPVTCLDLIDKEWYNKKGYYQKGKIWDLVQENMKRRC